MKAGIKKQEVKFIVTDEYREWIALIKDRIRNSQIKASIKVNRELLELYWHIGKDIVNRQKHSKWGEGLLRQMSIDLKKTFPDMAGFSETNLKTMRLWYRFYAEVVNGQQVVDELRSDDIFRLITTIPWGHNQRIIFKCKDVREAVFYAQYTLENNWSRDVLEHQIESGLYERKGKAITNFKDKLPANASDLAVQTLKDPYSFDFLTINLPHLPTSAYHPQDTVLHIQGDCLLPKHLRHIQSMALFSILLPLFRSLSVKHIRQKWLRQYSYGAYYTLRK